MRRASLALPLLILAACGPKYRKETLGTGVAGGEGVALSAAGEHRIDWRVQTPRALRFAWSVDCGGAQASGSGGETFEQYRDRRIAEIRAERDQQKKAVGAVLGAVSAGADVQTPEGEGHVEAGVNGDAVADAVISDDVQLPPGDFGPGFYGGTITVFAQSPGACRMQIGPDVEGEDMSGVSMQFQVTHVIDIAAEKAAMRAERQTAAIAVRGSLSARLVEVGADPELRARLEAQAQAEAAARAEAEMQVRRETEVRAQAEADAREAEEARVRAEADAQAKAELEVKLRIEADARAKAEAEALARAEAEAEARGRVVAEGEERVSVALEVRQRCLGILVGYGADPGLRQREADARAQADYELQLRLQAEADARARAEAEVRAKAEAEARLRAQAEADARARLRAEGEARIRVALELRTRIAGMLVGYGADPYFRQRQAEAEIAARAQADAEAQARFDAEEAAHAERIAELDRRARAALGIRSQVSAYLMMLGAIEKPPMPEAPFEDPGQPPMDGATWVAGEWVWQDAQWVWISGGWTFPDDGFSVSVNVGNDERPVETRPVVEDHRDEQTTTYVPPPPKEERPKVEDHRDAPKQEERPKVQDHRDEKKEEPKDEDRPKVRDHRH